MAALSGSNKCAGAFSETLSGALLLVYVYMLRTVDISSAKPPSVTERPSTDDDQKLRAESRKKPVEESMAGASLASRITASLPTR